MGGALSGGVGPGNQDNITLAVAGRRGSGKSTFINTVAGRDILQIGHALKHNPYDILPVECSDPGNKERKISFVELPGFDCESLEIYEKKLKRWLRELSSKNLGISGILYLHPITDVKLSTTASWLKTLCEHTIQGSPKRMVLVTTKWGSLRSVAIGVRREREFQRHWDELTNGIVVPRTLRFEDSVESAWSTVANLMENPVCGSPIELFIPATITGEKIPTKPRRYKHDFPPPAAMASSLSTGSYNEKSSSPLHFRGPVADPRRRACTLPYEAPAVLNYYDPKPKNSEPYSSARTLISEVIKDAQQNAMIAELCGEEAQSMVDFMNVVLHEENALAAHEGRSILALLSKLAKTNQMFPQCYDLNGVHFDNIPQGGGGFADIYKGTYQDKTICLKIVRLFQQNDNSLLLKAHVKELILWAHLRHQNILPFHGVYTVNDGRICIVSPWMNNGDLSRYLKNFPETPRNPLVSDIIAGLSYLHRSNIVHGDLKAPNVLVSDYGRALLADFGISSVVTSTGLMPSNTHTSNGTTRWIAPEVITESIPAPTRESDMWSLSCLIYEVYTRKVPFYQYNREQKVIAVLHGGQEIPMRPEVENQFDAIDDRVWQLMTQCWSYSPEKRPSCEGVQKSFAELQFPDDRLPIPTNDEDSCSAFWKAMKAMSDFQTDCKDVLKILRRIRNKCVVAGM